MNLSGCSIALVGPLPPPSGGMANQTLQLEALLQSAGATVEIIRVNPPYKPAWVAHIKGLRAVFRLLVFMTTIWRSASRNDLFHVMANSGWSWHLFAAPVVWIGSFRNTPVLINYRGGEAESFFQRSWSVVKPTIDRSAGVIVPSGFLESVFNRFGIKSRVVPNILDVSRFAPNDSRPEHSAPHLIVTRNLEAIYDVATSIRAFSRIKERFQKAQLTVAGSGPQETMLKQLTQDLSLHDAVNFTGTLSHEDIVDLYQGAHLMLNSSIADNSPNSLIEAMASGVPVISTDVGGIPFLIESDVSGILVPPSDEVALADAAIRVLEDAELMGSLRENALKVVRRFDKAIVLDILGEEYVRVMQL